MFFKNVFLNLLLIFCKWCSKLGSNESFYVISSAQKISDLFQFFIIYEFCYWYKFVRNGFFRRYFWSRILDIFGVFFWKYDFNIWCFQFLFLWLRFDLLLCLIVSHFFFLFISCFSISFCKCYGYYPGRLVNDSSIQWVG